MSDINSPAATGMTSPTRAMEVDKAYFGQQAQNQFSRVGSIGKLALALSKAQGIIKPALKDTENEFFKAKYATLAGVWEACREALTQNELAVIQQVCGGPDTVTVITTLVHSSGEQIQASLTIKPDKNNAQGIGSASTYARRYGLAAIVGVAPDDDDDGNAPAGKTKDSPKVIVTNEDAKKAIAEKAGKAATAALVLMVPGIAPNGQPATRHVPCATRTAFLDEFDRSIGEVDDVGQFFDMNAPVIGEIQAAAKALKNKQGDAIVTRVAELHARVHAMTNPQNPLAGAQ